jgi:hypothetical protein
MRYVTGIYRSIYFYISILEVRIGKGIFFYMPDTHPSDVILFYLMFLYSLFLFCDV